MKQGAVNQKNYNHKMRKIILAFSFLLICAFSFPQKVIQLIGIDVDDSSYANGSYSTMYDNTDDKAYEGRYTPYHTIAVSRDGDNVKFLRQNYLVVPTAKGFRYLTNEVTEIPNDTTENEFDFEKEYTLQSSVTKPVFFTQRKKVQDYILSLEASFVDAIHIDYEKISFITPDFYITEGFESEVHGGASWFDATEKLNFYKLNPAFSPSSNYMSDYADRKLLNQIIKDAVLSAYYDGEAPEENIDEDYGMPWAGRLGDYQDVYFSFVYVNNRIKLVPYVLLNGNAHRSFIAQGDIFEDENINHKFGLKQYGEETDGLCDFVSPDESTRISIGDEKIKVYDHKSGRLLAENNFPRFHKIVMSEWALGKHVISWEKEF